nr:ATP-binding protein [Myxococcus xanthus]
MDEIGYLSYDARNADLLFLVVSRRPEKKPIVLTTNLPVSEWTTLFPTAACAIALIDRVIHHASIISIEGDRKRQGHIPFGAVCAEGQESERPRPGTKVGPVFRGGSAAPSSVGVKGAAARSPCGGAWRWWECRAANRAGR